MRQLVFKVSLPDELFAELQTAATECERSPASFCAESLEAVLASRRLGGLTPQQGARGPRARAELMADTRPMRAERMTERQLERRTAALRPADVPTLADAEILSDIA